MKFNSISRGLFVVLLSWCGLLGLAVSNVAVATVEYKVLQSLGQHGGKPYSKLVQDAAGNLYGTTSGGGNKGYREGF